MKAAIIDRQTSEIVNVVEVPDDYDSKAEGAYLAPEGYALQVDPDGKSAIGGRFELGKWVKPEPVVAESAIEEPPQPSVEDRLAQLEDEIRGMKERAASASLNDNSEAARVRDAITGPPE
jgi:hypothetical protein